MTTLRFNAEERGRLVQAARRDTAEALNELRRRHPGHDVGEVAGHCVLANHFLAARLRAAGADALLQAGSAWFPTGEAGADGSYDTFGYQFDTEAARLRLVAEAALPEMHAWTVVTPPGARRHAGADGRAVVPAAGVELIDPLAGYQPARCLLTTGRHWRGASPPDFLWVGAARLPRGYRFVPDPYARQIALAFAAMFLHDEPLVITLPRRPR